MRAARRVRQAGWTAGVLAVFLVSGHSALGARTLVQSPTRIQGFAQDGSFIAWNMTTRHGFTCRTFIRSLASGRQGEFRTRSAGCVGRGGHRASSLALARGRALWETLPDICGTCNPARLFTATLGSPDVVNLGTLQAPFYGGRDITGLVGDGRLLAFSWVEYEFLTDADGFDCVSEPTIPCMWEVDGGLTARVVNRARRPVPGVHRPVLLAAGGERLALAPSVESWDGFRGPHPAQDGAVDVLDPKTGIILTSVSPAGTARALALSAGALAVFLERADGSLVIERYSIPAGRLIAATTVDPYAAFESLDIARKWIVYGVRHQIRLIGPLGRIDF